MIMGRVVFGAVLMCMLVLPMGLLAQSSPVWNGTADTRWYTAAPDAEEYQISTAEQLAGLAELVNSEEQNFSGRTILLTRTLVLNDTTHWRLWRTVDANGDTIVPARVWQPIGYLLGTGFGIWHTAQNISFQGTFDGQGHQVVGMFVQGTTGRSGWGLFGHISGATLRNLEMAASRVFGGFIAGSLVGHSGGGLVDNVSNRGHVTGIEEVGGLVGNNGGIILGCSNSGTVQATLQYAGGLVGYNHQGVISDVSNLGLVFSARYSGGLVGYNSGGTVQVCTNSAEISGSMQVGGIVGHNDGHIDNCHNHGSIHFQEPLNPGSSAGFLGGVVGSNDSVVSFCSNVASVASSNAISYVGGIAGSNQGTIKRCFNRGPVSSERFPSSKVGGITGENIVRNEHLGILESSNDGPVWGDLFVGGLVGMYTGRVERSFNRASVTGKTFVGGLFGSVAGPGNRNIYNQGDVVGVFGVGAISGESNTSVSNAYNTGSVTGSPIRTAPTTYTLGDTDSAMQKTREQFTNGELARLLQGDQDSLVWGHSVLGADEFPRLAWEDSLVRRVVSLGFRSSSPDHQQQSLALSHPIVFPDLQKAGHHVVWKDSSGRVYGLQSVADGDVLLVAHWEEGELVTLVQAAGPLRSSAQGDLQMHWQGHTLYLRTSQVEPGLLQVALLDPLGRVYSKQRVHFSAQGEARVVFAQIPAGSRVVVVQGKM